ncbi:MAG: IPT/TIG domain-containing protein [Methanoregula sp.]
MLTCIAIVLLPACIGLVSAASVPLITGLSPSGGPITGGTAVTITGSGFSGATNVQFGGKSGAALNIVNDSQLTIITPPNPAGTVPVSIISAAGVGSSREPSTMYMYEEVSRPRISGISPSSGPVAGSTVVDITGSGFTGTEYVLFGGKYAMDLNVVDDSHLTVMIPAFFPGSVPISVKNAAGIGISQEPSTMYLYEFPLPEPTGISPSSGSTAGGTAVTVTGSGFSGATDVQFGGKSGTGLTVIDDSQLTIISPSYSAGTVPLSVINPEPCRRLPGISRHVPL